MARRRELSRKKNQRKALLGNLATSLFKFEKIKTTNAKAKELKRLVEPLITRAKKGGLSSIRKVGRTIQDKEVLKKLFNDIAKRFTQRKGGYTRILRLGPRPGDRAPMVIIQLVQEESKKE